MGSVLTYYLITINAVAFLLMLIDKYKAKNNLWRIPERTLLLPAFLGGSLGAFLGMRLARHKTRKPKFYITIPILLIGHIALMIYYIAM